jgi:enoyl-CoA hydratase/carnithine racemase
MPTEDPVLYERRGAAAWIWLNRPEVQNALNPAMVDQIEALLARAETDETVRVVVVAGVGDTFCAGADLATIPALETYEVRARFGKRMGRTGAVFRIVEAFPKPVIAAVAGMARAGGLELMLCCDLVVAGRRALFGDAHSTHGQLPGGGASVRLPRRVGATRAKHLLFTGDLVPAQTFLEWGLVNEVVDDDQLVEATDRLASLLAEKSPESLRRMKRLIDDGLAQPMDTALRLEILAAEVNLGSDDMAEGMRAIAEDRPPAFGTP